MILYKNRIFGGVGKFFTTVFTFIYNVFAFLNLQITILLILTGIILYFVGVFQNSAVAEMIFFIALILSVFYAVVTTVRNLLFPKPKEEKKRLKPEIVKGEKGKNDKGQPLAEEDLNGDNSSSINEQTEKPKFYKVKQNHDYLMAEYSDRFELFVKTPEGLKRVRTDYKENLK